MPARTFFITNDGNLVRIGQGIPSYHSDIVDKVLSPLVALDSFSFKVNKMVLEFPKMGAKNSWDVRQVVVYAHRSPAACNALVRLLRIGNGKLETGFVLATYDDGSKQLFRRPQDAWTDRVPVTVEPIDEP